MATSLVNGIKQIDGFIKSLTPRKDADSLGHTTSEITEMYYVKRDMTKLNGITDGVNLQIKTSYKLLTEHKFVLAFR